MSNLISFEDIEFALTELSKREYSHYREILTKIEELEKLSKRIERLEKLLENECKDMRNL
ncbi:MAG: hypothetical protein ACTSXD_13440 [Candidatus Heimdallarchaeaceae archaeon]